MGIFLLVHGASISARPFIEDSAAWKEQVELHNGDRIIVERSYKLGGRREPGQGPPMTEQTAAFTLPGTNNKIVWHTTYGLEESDSNLELLAIEVANGSAYLVARPVNCIAYNRWGRPNPFYVFFVYGKDGWRHIPITDVPSAIKTPNVLLGPLNYHKRLKEATAPLMAEEIRKANTKATEQPSAIHYRVFGREPVTSGRDNLEKACRDVIYKYNAERKWIEEIPRPKK
ncbi:MAG: hypothetical protein ACREX0_15700 [Noviherbaspirillum sp.]